MNDFKLHLITFIVLAFSCNQKPAEQETDTAEDATSRFLNEPLIADHFTADPSAHVFNGKLYIYPSHDIASEVPQDDWGSHFNMEDYKVYSMSSVPGPVTDHGTVLHADDVPWAYRQLWAPDAAEKDGKYYLYFPAKDENDIFKIGVAIADQPEGPFTAEPEPIAGTFSIDPAVYQDEDNAYYLYWGGIWGGQLQRWTDGTYQSMGDQPTDGEPADGEPALAPKVARLAEDMVSLAEAPRDVVLLQEDGTPILAGDHDKRFFEAAWVHKYQDTYYFSYSTGDTHFIAYATGDNPYGPFTYSQFFKVLCSILIGFCCSPSLAKDGYKLWLQYGGHLFIAKKRLMTGPNRPTTNSNRRTGNSGTMSSCR